VLDMVIEEIEPDGTVVFEWRSVDHFNVTDAQHEDLTGETVDHVHPNSLDLDADGNILLSSRHLDEVTKISRATGAIIWRLGGKNNQFTFTNDPGHFSHQHDARRIANGNILLFDNGNYHAVHYSRAVEYRLDEQAKTATRVWQYRHTPDIYGYAMGNAQRLPNGNTMIGWGASNVITEVRPDGTIAFEMTMPPGVFTYRAFRLPAASRSVKTTLLAPANDTTGLPASVRLTWERTGGASGYHVQVATDAAFTSPVYDEEGLDATSAAVPGLVEWTQYFWRVRAIGEEIDGTWSDTWTFTTGGTPLVLTLVSPPQGATALPMAPALRWAPFAGATGYDVQLSANDLFFTAPIVDTTIGASVLWLDRISGGDRFYWRVRPRTATGTGNWSQVWDFRTAPAVDTVLPQKIDQILPAASSTVPLGNLRFVWQPDAASAMTQYRLSVATRPTILEDPAASGILVDTTTGSADLVVPTGTLSAGTYWWLVRGTNDRGEQFSSPLGTFTIDAATGIAGSGSIAAITLAPNPAGAIALLRVTLARSAELDVRLVDVRGVTVARPFSGPTVAGTRVVTLRLDELPEGVYFCAVSTAEGTSVHRLVVAH
jgi:hypothetical protein